VTGFIQCGDDWVALSTVGGISIEAEAIGYAVKVRSSAFGFARTYGRYETKAEAIKAVKALVEPPQSARQAPS
jgi:hypothetical protein